MIRDDILSLFRVPPGKAVRVRDHDPGWAQTEEMEELGKEAIKERARQILDQNLAGLAEAQELLYADDRYALLIVLQAMDAAGKDGTIKHVMSGVNPQGCQVFSFKKPSAEELDHDFLWRYTRCLPERGRIGIFNRSYYEDVLVTRVHPELLTGQRLPGRVDGKKFWRRRYQDINAFERHLVRSGTVVLKCDGRRENVARAGGRRSARKRSAHGLAHGLGTTMGVSLTPSRSHRREVYGCTPTWRTGPRSAAASSSTA